MDDGVKQRIVGAFVLVALAVIFVPVFFDRERIAPVDRESQIPLAPEFGETVVNIEELEFELENEKEGEPVPQTVQDLQKQSQEAKKQDKKLSPTVVPAKSVTRVTPAPSSNGSSVVQPKNVQVVAATRAPTPVATPVPTPVPTPFPTMPPNNSVPPQDMYVPRENNSLTAEELAAEPDDGQQLNSSGVTDAWVLQVGSFGIETHAKQMRDDLIAMGYRSFVRSIETSKGKMTRVFVGPKIDKNRLLEAQKAVEAKYNLKGIIVRFEP